MNPSSVMTWPSGGSAATDKQPKLRYPAGRRARRVSRLRRYVPPTMFDKQIRKLNKLTA